MKKTVLVSGGAGFIGTNLCESLLNLGNIVYCIDDFSSGRIQNIKRFFENRNFHFHRCSITKLPQFLHSVGFDEIYNLACPASPITYQKCPTHTLMSSVLGIKNILDLAKETGAKVLQSSTSEVYGDPATTPQSEDYWGNVNPIGLRSCYDEGKRCAESLCMIYARQGVDVKIIRIFNTYGPCMAANDGRFIPNFIMQALKGEPLTIYGDGMQTRSPQYITDLINGMKSMMETPKNIVGPINIGNPDEHTIEEVAKLIIQLTNSKSEIIYMPLPEDDPKRRKPDIRTAKKNPQLGTTCIFVRWAC